MKKNQLELLAPAGSYDIFRAVLNAGADAVYVGGGQFGARAYANNFSEEELLRAIDEAHIHGKQLYLTVNTLLKEEELEAQLYDFLIFCLHWNASDQKIKIFTLDHFCSFLL